MTDERSPIAAEHAAELSTLLGDYDLSSVPGTSSLAAWFLGPKAENEELLSRLVLRAVKAHCDDRRSDYHDDPPYVTEEMKSGEEYRGSVREIEKQLEVLLKALERSVPFCSYRYQAHMNWDLTLPSIVGYFAAMLYNQNNVAVEGSPVTTLLETVVGDDLCRMLGYTVPRDENASPRPWGHITCDGTVANIEALWSARSLKYYPIAVAEAIRREHDLRPAGDIEVSLPDGTRHCLLDLDPWSLLNLPVDEVLDLPRRIVAVDPCLADELYAVNNHTIQYLGYEQFAKKHLGGEVKPPVVLAPITKHYSWPKAAMILGIGEQHLLPIEVDLDARARPDHVRELLGECAAERRPVLAHVVVLGSTEQSSVDPLAEMLRIRADFHQRNLTYPIHVDAAWGGYFASLLRPGPLAETPELWMSEYVTAQYEALPQADSITIDPHKAGFIPYPAGGLCYRNKAQRELISISAPYVSHGGVDPSVGFYGIEGSKPGAAAAGVYLSHRVISTDQNGYGKLLGKALFNSKRFYAAIVTMATDNDPFVIVPCQRLPAERTHPGDEAKLNEQLAFIRERIVPKTNDELLADPEALRLLQELGSDQVIIAYIINFKRDGVLNPRVDAMNALNRQIYHALNITPSQAVGHQPATPLPPLIVTGSQFSPDIYGPSYLHRLRTRLGIEDGRTQPLDYLISTTMDPWVTDTATGDFTPTLITALRDTVTRIIRENETADIPLPIPTQAQDSPAPMTPSKP
ncbi:pyridoxal-dependent decarboxylase [Actinokineospora sp. UTMC 2448]|uniref:pyridoxal phosphate-dependent decarboxylase family protein n=1 Tax=Actinokineospora sp. UTMC 2448 TaxID=2268449 RepID=UPI002164E727|nr:pyridoxal-dependent decarboxylase [Actinokineospora sp. UTMC 2448]UVS80469.1 L-2,4-diaminobutyrate decarboxylase [Actinokineospora sp. UTMC 2448]